MIKKLVFSLLIFLLVIQFAEITIQGLNFSPFIHAQTRHLATPNNKARINSQATININVADINGNGISMVKIYIGGILQIKRTDMLGNFSAVVESGNTYIITVVKDYYAFTPKSLSVTTGPDGVYNLLFTGYIIQNISGTVKDSKGKGLPGIKIILSGSSNREKTTNIGGLYLFDSLAKGSYTVTPQSTIYLFNPENYSFPDLTTDARQKDFVASQLPVYSISGYVKDETGIPLAGVKVALSGNSQIMTLSNDEGLYTFSGLPAGTYIVNAAQNGYMFIQNTKSVTLTINSIDNINFTAKKYFTISGTIIESLNKALPDVVVSLTGSKTLNAVTDHNGSYFFDTLFSGPVKITPVLYSYTFNPPFIELNQLNSNITGLNFSALKLELLSLSGRIVDKKGNPLKNVLVIISGSKHAETYSLTDGTFTFNELESGSYTLSFYCIGFLFPKQNDTINLTGSTTGMLIEAEPYYRVSGAVRNRSGNPLVNLSLLIKGENMEKFTLSDIEGRYYFDSLVANAYSISINETGYKTNPVKIEITNLNKNLSDANFSINKIYKISGSTADPLNAPIRGVKISIFGSDTTEAYSDETGSFFADSVSEGQVKLKFYSDGVHFDPEELIFSPLIKDETNIFVCGYITLSGKILSMNAQPANGIQVFLNGKKTDSCKTNIDGFYNFNRLPFGGYIIKPFCTGYSFIPEYYHYDSLYKSKYEQNITGISSIMISGRVNDIKLKPLSGIEVELSNGSLVKTNSGGSFIFSDLQKGDYTITPKDSLYKFYPEKYDYHGLSSAINEQNFTAKRIINISGKISDCKNKRLYGVKVTDLIDTSIYAYSDTNGIYSFIKLESGNFRLQPFEKGVYFSPQEITLNQIDSSVSGADFTGFIKISGLVIDTLNKPLLEAEIRLSGEINQSAVTNPNGYYEFTELPIGNYKTGPVKEGYKFIPAEKVYNKLSFSIENDTFLAFKLPAISGKIHDIKNRLINSVALSIIGDTSFMFTSNGNFNIYGLKPGNYLLTPLKTGMKFIPSNFAFSQINNENINIDFLGCLSLSGQITDTLKQAKQGIEIQLSGELLSTAITDKNGFYSFDSLCCGIYSVTPKSRFYNFLPEILSFTGLDHSLESQNFICKINSAVGIDSKLEAHKTAVANNFPNPFNSSTTIKFSIDRTSIVSLSVYDLLGRKTGELLSNKLLEPNEYGIRWEGGKSSSSSGIYFYVLEITNREYSKIFTRRMLLLK